MMIKVMEMTRPRRRAELEQHGTLGATRTLDSHACRLRKKLNAHGDSFVVNVWGVGYRLLDGGIE